MATDGPAALRRLADDIRKNDNLRFTAQLIDNFAHDWDAERAQAAADRAALATAQHANDAERGEWSEYYALLTGDRGAWSPDDMRRAVKAQTDALAQAQEALTEDREKWSFDTALYVGALLLAKVYPENVFTGASGDPGPTYIAALRAALLTYAQRNELAQARALLTELYDDSPCRFDHHGHCQEHNSMTDVCIMRRIAAALSGGAR